MFNFRKKEAIRPRFTLYRVAKYGLDSLYGLNIETFTFEKLLTPCRLHGYVVPIKGQYKAYDFDNGLSGPYMFLNQVLEALKNDFHILRYCPTEVHRSGCTEFWLVKHFPAREYEQAKIFADEQQTEIITDFF